MLLIFFQTSAAWPAIPPRQVPNPPHWLHLPPNLSKSPLFSSLLPRHQQSQATLTHAAAQHQRELDFAVQGCIGGSLRAVGGSSWSGWTRRSRRRAYRQGYIVLYICLVTYLSRKYYYMSYNVQQQMTTLIQCLRTKTSFFSGLWQKPSLNGVPQPILQKKNTSF